ncbi:restriction endonuclease [Brevibacillus sp. SYSU BS000544]|uniref:restriction endonuclease n=1 Tax=Brevibacillus sp. SYSU BS000544 TaxID=3416443 RepID=UPI003CE4AB9B
MDIDDFIETYDLSHDDESNSYIICKKVAEGIKMEDVPEAINFFFHRDEFESRFGFSLPNESIPEGIISINDGNSFIWMSHCWQKENWQFPLNISHHIDLMSRLLLFREQEFKDVSDIQFENMGTHVLLNYAIHPKNVCLLSDIFKYGYSVLDWVDQEVNKTQELLTEQLKRIQSDYSKLKLVEVPALIEKIKVLIDNKDKDQRNQKGLLLEELISKLFASVPGFTVSERVRTKTEEIDIVVLNRSTNPFWLKETPLILVECKNWSSKCGKDELILFKDKILNRRGRAKLGYFISWNGFKSTFKLADLRTSQDDILIVPIDGQELMDSIDKGNFDSQLQHWWSEALKN